MYRAGRTTRHHPEERIVKALKFFARLFNDPKFEIYWAILFLSALISHIVGHTTRTADGWHMSLSGWDVAYAAAMAISFVWSFRTWWREGRA